MMNSSSIMRREDDYKLKRKALEGKEEVDTNNNSTDSRYSLKLSSSNTRQWSEYSKNPRIVSVSRSFKGKDRHSKVCTIRGLRDRRIRLSVPTAIQLYDLQDKLGLGQPSKVIDWLIDATKSDIDNLPPLQFPHGFGTDQFHQQMLLNSASQSSSFAPFSFDTNSTTFSKEDQYHGQVQALTPRFFPVAGVFNSGTYYDWEPSNLSLSQFGNHGFQISQGEENSLNNNIPNPNPMLLPLSLPLPSSRLFFSPNGTAIASTNHHPPYVKSINEEKLTSHSSQKFVPSSRTIGQPGEHFQPGILHHLYSQRERHPAAQLPHHSPFQAFFSLVGNVDPVAASIQ